MQCISTKFVDALCSQCNDVNVVLLNLQRISLFRDKTLNIGYGSYPPSGDD